LIELDLARKWFMESDLRSFLSKLAKTGRKRLPKQGATAAMPPDEL
jgi:hypothetical protein